MYMYYVQAFCILYSVLCKTKTTPTKTTRVLGARGGRQSSIPAKETTHSGRGEKETHYMNVVGNKIKSKLSKI